MSEKAPPPFDPAGDSADRYDARWEPRERASGIRIDHREASFGVALRFVVFSVLVVSGYFVSLPVMEFSAQLSLDLEQVVQRPAR